MTTPMRTSPANDAADADFRAKNRWQRVDCESGALSPAGTWTSLTKPLGPSRHSHGTSMSPLQQTHRRPRWTSPWRCPPRTAACARAARLAVAPVNAPEDAKPDPPVGACLLPSQLLTLEVLRRPVESTLGTAVGVDHGPGLGAASPGRHLQRVGGRLGRPTASATGARNVRVLVDIPGW